MASGLKRIMGGAETYFSPLPRNAGREGHPAAHAPDLEAAQSR